MSDFCRRFLIVPFLLVLISQGCAISQSQSEVVCITKTGAKYHRCHCRYVANSSHEIKLDEALKRGYDPCSVCKPSAIEADTEARSTESNPVEQVKSDKPESNPAPLTTQCTALTKAGSRCKRSAASGGNKCWQHQGK